MHSPGRRSDAMTRSAGHPSATAFRASFPTATSAEAEETDKLTAASEVEKNGFRALGNLDKLGIVGQTSNFQSMSVVTYTCRTIRW